MSSAEQPQQLRIGVIGAGGFVGRTHVDAARRTGRGVVTIIGGREPASTQLAAARVHVPRWTTDIDELLAEVDVVHNCTPTQVHAEVALAVLAAGRHLVSEKPLAGSLEQAIAVEAESRRAGVVSALCHNYRFLPMVQEARALVASGAIGTPHLVHGHYLQDWLSRAGVETWRLDPSTARSAAMADIGTHWCDLAAHVTGRPIVEVDARLGRLHGRALDDHGALLLRLAGNVMGSVVVSQASPGHDNRLVLKVDGDEGSLTWNQERPDELTIGRQGAPNQEVRKAPGLLSDAARPLAHVPQGHTQGWASSFRDLFATVYGRILGEDPVSAAALPTFADGVTLMRLVEAVVRSDAENSTITLPQATS